MGLTFNHFDVLGPKVTEISKITQTKSHHDVQGYSRSPLSVPIESPYETSYQRTNLHHISHRFEDSYVAKFPMSTHTAAKHAAMRLRQMFEQ